MLREYLPILVFLAVAIGLGLVLILAAVVVAVRNPVNPPGPIETMINAISEG